MVNTLAIRDIHKPVELEPIKSHDEQHCTFAPDIPSNRVRDRVSSSGYGPDRVNSIVIKAKEAPQLLPDPDETYRPKLVKSEIASTLRKIVPSSGYGRKEIQPRVTTPKHPAAVRSTKVVPGPVGNPHEQKPRRLKTAKLLKSQTPSSGYACVITGGREYMPGMAKRGKLAEKEVELPETRRPSFQPKLFLSKAAQQMRSTIPGRRLQPRSKHPGYAQQDSLDHLELENLYSGRYDLLNSPERDLASDEPTPYSSGFILDGVAKANRELGQAGNKSRALSSGVKAGGYIGSPIDVTPHADHIPGEPDVW